MKTFTNKDIENYYDHTQVHYQMFWDLKRSMGLHYGIWDKNTQNIADAIINTNQKLMELGGFVKEDIVLDAGCGIGGSSIFLAKNSGCNVHGITLSARQVETATKLSQEYELETLVKFSQQDYTNTGFENNAFTKVWAIESMQTAQDKNLFFKEMQRIVKPGGHILFADIFKPETYDISNDRSMQTMLNGWAITDILSLDELQTIASDYHFKVTEIVDVSKEVVKSVNRIFWAAFAGMFGTKIYNLFYNATYFSKIHYKTGLAQKRTFKQGKWGYYLIKLEKLV